MRIQELIKEIHRRSIWQVLAVYIVGAWIGFEVIQTLTEGLGLPGWFPALAVVLFIIGLPIVLATAFVQESAPSPTEPDPTVLPHAAEREARHPSPEWPVRDRLAGWLTWRNALLGGLVAFALWGLVAAGWLLVGGPEDATESPRYRSLAVLPLDNYMGDPEQEYFVDGMTEQLIAELSQIGDLIVKSRTSVMRYKQTDQPVTEIGRELGADVVVEGSVARAEGKVRITAQLIETAGDRHLWAESYERDYTNVLALQSEVARAIAREIRVQLTPEEERRLSREGPVRPEAHDALTRGQYLLSQVMARGGLKAERADTIIAQFQRAVNEDPGWADAYAHLARAYHWAASSGIRPADYYPKSKTAALRAIELDPDNWIAYGALAFVTHYWDWDWQAAERYYRRRHELNPNQSWGLGLFLLSAGRYEEAIEAYREAELRNPNSVLLKTQLAYVYRCAGKADRAEVQLQHVLELDPAYARARFGLAELYMTLDRYGDALVQLGGSGTHPEVRTVLTGSAARELRGIVYAKTDREPEARRILGALEAAGDRFHPALLTALGMKGQAIAQYEAAYERHSDDLLYLRCHLAYEELRHEPRFREIVKRMNFPA